MSFIKNKRDTFEKRVYEIWRGMGLGWVQMNRMQGYDNTLLGPYPQIVEVKNSNVYTLEPREIEMKEKVESLGGRYWVVYDDATAIAAGEAAKGL